MTELFQNKRKFAIACGPAYSHARMAPLIAMPIIQTDRPTMCDEAGR